jgi:quinoprotein glucose dehydrogenase
MASCLSALAQTLPGVQPGAGWPTYGGDPGGQRYSAAREINRTNVTQLRPVWTYHTHALDAGRGGSLSASFESTPILFHGILYLTTPFAEIVALDPATGAERWHYQPPLGLQHEGDLTTSRGVASWEDQGSGVCSARIFVATLDGELWAVDAATGLPCEGFGEHGRVDVKQGLSAQDRDFRITSAPTVLGDVLVVGSSISDNGAVDMAKGTVRAYNARTGRPLWTWDPIPWATAQTIPTGAANTWSTIAADPALGLLYLPTGSASPDYYGGMRPGDGRDADSVVALDARTGKKVWAFQVVHHDLWDYDVASEPLLFTWHGVGSEGVPAIAVTTKMGMVFVLDRRTGVPLYPVEERTVPKSDVPGEDASATQPFSSLPPLSPLTLPNDEDSYQRPAEDAAFCRQQMAGLRYDGMYTPPSLRGSLVFPGAIGGVNWGSAAYDPGSGILYANTNRLPYAVQLISQDPWIAHRWLWVVLNLLFGMGLLFWFGSRRRWGPGRPVAYVMMLVAVAGMLWYAFLFKGRPFTVRDAMSGAFGEDHSPQNKAPYRLYRHPLLDHHGLPCTPGIWGTVAALNLQTGVMAWQQAHGTQVAGASTGAVSLGGVMVTAGGLVFSAGTKEPLLRAYDAASGRQLWQGVLPTPAQATPMSYELDGKQYIVIAAGGHGLYGTRTGDTVVAMGLP